jgi:hypothetical protein
MFPFSVFGGWLPSRNWSLYWSSLPVTLTPESESERVTLRLAVQRQSVLGAKPLEAHDQGFFFLQLNSCGHISHVTPSVMRGWVCLLGTGFASSLSSVRIAHIAWYCKFFLVHYIHVLCQYRLYRGDHAYLTYLSLQQQLSHLNGRKLDHRQV